jgi:RsiW-degrading membrane proteinase PrsW (M82 family)
VLATLRWLLPATLPVALFAAELRTLDRHREPPWLVGLTFALGMAAAALALLATGRATALTGLDVRVSAAGESGALVFLFLVVTPLHEAAKIAAVWPAFASKHVHEDYDGAAYATASALGFAAIETAAVLRHNPDGAIWIVRTIAALPAHVFFACLWGYALGRAKMSKHRLPIFPLAFVGAIAGHGLYAHLVYGLGPGALVGVAPMLAGMGATTWIYWGDIRARSEAPPVASISAGRLSRLTIPPTLSAVRSALRRADEPVKVKWIAFGALVTLGAMIAGIAAGVLAAHLLHVDLSTVDERDLGSAAPALLLGVGLLGSFPTSGWLIARAAGVHSLLEPALATVLALGVTLIALGFAAPFTIVFALALSPIAWFLACAGAWVAI